MTFLLFFSLWCFHRVIKNHRRMLSCNGIKCKRCTCNHTSSQAAHQEAVPMKPLRRPFGMVKAPEQLWGQPHAFPCESTKACTKRQRPQPGTDGPWVSLWVRVLWLVDNFNCFFFHFFLSEWKQPKDEDKFVLRREEHVGHAGNCVCTSLQW